MTAYSISHLFTYPTPTCDYCNHTCKNGSWTPEWNAQAGKWVHYLRRFKWELTPPFVVCPVKNTAKEKAA